MSQTRSTTFDLIVPDGKLQVIRNHIRLYRAAIRQMYSCFAMANMAGVSYEEKDEQFRVKPNNDAAKTILESAMGKSGKAMGYAMREWFLKDLCPGFLSFVWDSARRDLESRWKAPDTEFPSAKRGYLTLQGARAMAFFNNIGIGFPAAQNPAMEGHTLCLKWDHTLGEIEFKLPSMDRGGRYHVWRNLRNKTPGWKLGTMFLNERDGKIVATVTHERPEVSSDVDADRELKIVFGGDSPDTLFKMVGPDGEQNFDFISCAETIGWLNKQRINRNILEGRRASTGAKYRPWGHRKGFEHAQRILSNLTLERTRRQESTNHAWSRRIVSRAEQWRCGKVTLVGFPKENLGGHPWSWFQFNQFLKYKCEEKKIKIGSVDAKGVTV